MATILVIDDDPGMRRVARLILENAHHTVIEVDDGLAVEHALSNCSPDLIVTDIVMPGREGIATIREIRRLGITAPVLAVSGGGQIDAASYLEAAVELGANRALCKPYRARELLAVIEDMLREHQDRAAAH